MCQREVPDGRRFQHAGGRPSMISASEVTRSCGGGGGGGARSPAHGGSGGECPVVMSHPRGRRRLLPSTGRPAFSIIIHKHSHLRNRQQSDLVTDSMFTSSPEGDVSDNPERAPLRRPSARRDVIRIEMPPDGPSLYQVGGAKMASAPIEPPLTSSQRPATSNQRPATS